jgi:competence protein ComEA
MRARPGPPADAVARRLELLSAELAAVRGGEPPQDTWSDAPDDGHTRLRPAPAPVADTPPPPIPVPGRHAARRRSRPLSLLDGRVVLAPAHLTVVAVVALLGLALTTWWALRGETETVAPVSAPEALVTPSAVAPTASASPAELVVDVAGKVRRPGLAVLEPGARVVDAIRAAGGARKGVDLSGLNLARVLVDGEQVLVGVDPPAGVAASPAGGPATGGAGPLVNINTASATELEGLPGVGPVTAEAILSHRTEHGAFTSVDQLLDVDGIGEATLAEIAPHVTL